MDTITALIKLQDVDFRLYAIGDLLGDFPGKVDDLTREEKQLVVSIEQRKTQIKDIDLEIAKKDLKVKEVQAKIDKLKDQLFLVQNNKQYDALAQEIDYLKEALDNNETTELELVEEKESLETEMKASSENLASLTADLHERKAKLKTLIAETAEQKETLEKERSSIVSTVAAAVITKYERILSARGGSAVVEININSCGGCGAVIPPQMIAEIKQKTHLKTCDTCNRFLCCPTATD